MKKFVNRVTVTGADDSVQIKDLVEIYKEFSFVEFGILLSNRAVPNGFNRFPSQKWLEELSEYSDNFPLAGHICDKWVKQILEYHFHDVNLTDLINNGDDLVSKFDRWQLNTHGYEHHYNKEKLEALYYLLTCDNCSIIHQYDEKNKDLLFDLIEEQRKDRQIDHIQVLFDLSHGTGVLPNEWPKPLNIPCGYAGGLSPENVKEQLEKLSNIVGDRIIWIDAETHLRSNGDQQFDLDKVRKFLKESQPYVI